MPFVMINSNEVYNDDIVKKKINRRTGEVIQQGNGYKPLVLTSYHFVEIDTTPDKRYSKSLERGTPNFSKRNWNDQPVFRVQTHLFDIEGQGKLNWERFMKLLKYDKEAFRNQIHYEPSENDIRVISGPQGMYPDYFPMHVIDYLDENGYFEAALNEYKVLRPGVKKITEQEYKYLKDLIKARREAEKGTAEKTKKKTAETVNNVQQPELGKQK